MELNNEKLEFTIKADDKNALERAILYINLMSQSDYKLIEFVSVEVGLATISVSKDKMLPEFLFMMGKRYEIYRKKTKINFI